MIAHPVALTPGYHFGGDEILSALGAGGMGEVYRAHDARLKRDVALKILPDSFAGDPHTLKDPERRKAELEARSVRPAIKRAAARRSSRLL